MSENKGTNKAAAATPTTAEPLFEVVAVYAVDRVGLVPVGAYEDANPSAAAAQYFEVAAVADIIAPSMNPSVASAAPGSDVSAPARNGTGPEPGAMDARDCIRRQFLGKRVKVRYVAGRVAHVLRATDDETVAMALVKRGLAVPRDGIREHAWRTALENASSEARRQGRGKWSLAPISERSRHITPFPAAAKSLQEQSLVATLVGATMNVTVEDVISVNRLQAVTVSSLQEFTFRIAGVGYPTFTDPAVSAAIADKLSDALFDGKALLRRRLLHREVRISVEAYDATARVFHGSLLATGVSGSSSTLPHQNSELLGSPTKGPAAPPSAAGNIAPLVLKLLSSGWAVVERVNLSLTPSPNELLEAEFNARSTGKGLWAHVPPSAVEVGRVLDTDPFDGTVTEVHSPNVVTIVSEASGQSTDVMLAFVHADPVEREPETPMGIVVKYTTRWLTARQHLRTIALGRVVRCVPIAAPPHRLMIANISLLDEAAVARANLTVELAAAGVCELRPVSLRPTFDLQLEPPSEILALVPSAPHAAASAGLVHIEDDDDGDIPVVAAKQPIRATPGRMTKTTPARPGSSPDLASRAPPAAPLFDDPFAGASADLFAGARAAFHSTAVTVAAGSKTEAESVPPPLPPGQGSDGGGSTTPVSILHAARHRSALSRVNLPLGTPLVADVEAVDNFATLLCLVPACGVAVPVVLAGIALSPDDIADTVHGMRLNLLHQRVTIEVTGLALSDAAFAAVVRTPSIPNVAAQLLVMGLGVVTRLCEVYAQHETEVESLLAAEEAARHHRAGLWHESRQEYRTHLLSLLPAAGVVPCVSGRPIEAVHADCVSFVERTLTSGNLHVVTLSFDAASQLFLAQFVNELDVNAAFAALQQAAEAAPFIPFSDDAAVPDADVVGQSVLASRTNTQTAIVCWCRATIVAISESGENKARLFTLRYVDFGDSATIPASQIRAIDNAARGDRHRRPLKSNGKRREAAARQAAAHVDDAAAAAIVTLATTPSLVSEFRLAYVIINVMTPAVRRILSLAEHPDGLFPVVEYVWQNQPYVSLYRNKDAVAAGEASFSSLLLQETQPGEVDVDLRLMDVPQLVTAVAALLSTPRAQLVQPADVVEARPTATSKRGAGRVNGKGRGTTNHSSVAAETAPPTVAKPAVPSSTRRRAPVTA